MNSSPFYKNTGKIFLASNISFQFRKKMFHKFMDAMQPQPHHLILDIGVTSDDTFQESNYFEKMYPYKNKVICVGTENGKHLETKYPGLRFQKVVPGQPLPFANKTFDIAFSNAVLEHVGNTTAQVNFIQEMVRVSNSFFITTPNRWFPVELHTAIPLLHFLPKNIYRKILSIMGETYWSKEENLNLLSRGELQLLFKDTPDVVIGSIKMLWLSTNLIAYKRNL